MKNNSLQHMFERIKQAVNKIENRQLAQDLWYILGERHFEDFYRTL